MARAKAPAPNAFKVGDLVEPSPAYLARYTSIEFRQDGEVVIAVGSRGRTYPTWLLQDADLVPAGVR